MEGDQRLHYGMGMHIIHCPDGYDLDKANENNTSIQDSLVVLAL